MVNTISEIDLYRYNKGAGDSHWLAAMIVDNGDLQLEGYDIGDSVEEFWGDDDYEYWVTVASNYKDTLLLHLLKERFKDSSSFMAWLKQKDIPYQFDSYV